MNVSTQLPLPNLLNSHTHSLLLPVPPPISPSDALVSDKDVVKARVKSVPKKTREDTKYCVNLWEEWRNYRLQHTNASIPLLLEMTNADL